MWILKHPSKPDQSGFHRVSLCYCVFNGFLFELNEPLRVFQGCYGPYWLWLSLEVFESVVILFTVVWSRLQDLMWKLSGFYWVLMSWNGFYWVLLGFTGFYWVKLVFIRFFLVLLGFTGFHWVLMSFTGFYWVLSSFIGFYWVSLGFTGF